MAQTALKVTSVDPHDGRGTDEPRYTLTEFLKNLEKHGVADKVESFTSIDEATDKYEFIFIDGAHDYESVTQDIEDAMNRLSEGGIIAFHDYRTEPHEHDGGWDEGVTRAVNEFVLAGAKIVSQTATVVAMSPPVRKPMEI